MNVLFIARHFTYFRNFESVIATLADRGHTVHLAADREEALGGRELVDRLAARYPAQVSVGFAPILQWGRYRRVSSALRIGLDYLRYSDPRYEATPKIRERAYERTPLLMLALATLPFRGLLTRLLTLLERAVPRQRGVDEFIAERKADVLLITPLIELGSPQLDYMRAARALGIRSALCVWSWDHLSSKALIRVVPDKVIVWNQTQQQEAQRFHGIPADRVLVTGAQCFDQWFDRSPTRSREAFCLRVGFADTQPFLLYVCSALFRGSPSEAAFVLRWIASLRQSSDARLRDMPILVRPHPQRIAEWTPELLNELAAMKDVVLWGSNPVDAESRADYFDSMYHAAAIVGLNTSALVESAIVDRPVFTVLLPEFRESQEGTFHFHYLLDATDGFLNISRSLDEHAAQLAAVLNGGTARSNRRFVEHFVRPRGAAVAATPVFADAVETIARDTAPARRATESPLLLLLQPVIYALVLAARLPLLEQLFWNVAKRRKWEEERNEVVGSETATPRTGWTMAAYALAVPLIAGLSATTWGVPMPLTDNLTLILQAQSMPLLDILRNGFLEQALLRPLYEALYKGLFVISGGHYYLAYQGFHIAMFAVTVLLCVTALRVRTAADFVGAGVMLVVLLGLHTFTNVLRELPIVVVTSCALAMTLAFSGRSSRWRDSLAMLNFVIAVFYVETGLLVWVIHAGAFILGQRGLSRAGIGMMTALFVGYFGLRFLILPAGELSLFPRYTGIGFSIVDEDELLRRFGDRALLVYAYNVLASIGSTLFSEPRGGVFEFTRRLLEGELRPWMWLNLMASGAVTGTVVWFLAGLGSSWRRWMFSRAQAMVLVALLVVLANAMISYPYSRDVTMSPAGLCYALAAGMVVSALVQRMGDVSAARRAVATAVVLLISVTWSLRTVAQTYSLRTAAFVHRNEWVGAEEWLRRVGRPPADERGVVLVRTLRREAISMTVPNPALAQPYAERYLSTSY